MQTCVACIYNLYYVYDDVKQELLTYNQAYLNSKQGNIDIVGLETYPLVFFQKDSTNPWAEESICNEHVGPISYGKFLHPTFILSESVKLPKLDAPMDIIYKGVRLTVTKQGTSVISYGFHRLGTASEICELIDKYDTSNDFYIYDIHTYQKRLKELCSCLTFDKHVTSYIIELCGLFKNQPCMDLTCLEKEYLIQGKKIEPYYSIETDYAETPYIQSMKIKNLKLTRLGHNKYPKVSWMDATQFSSKDFKEIGLSEFITLVLQFVKRKGVIIFKRQRPTLEELKQLLPRVKWIDMGNINTKNQDMSNIIAQIQRQQSKCMLILPDNEDTLSFIVVNLT